MAAVVVEKIARMQREIAELSDKIDDHQYRIRVLEESVARLVIPRITPTGSSSPSEHWWKLKTWSKYGSKPSRSQKPEVPAEAEITRELLEALPPDWRVERVQRVGVIRPRLRAVISKPIPILPRVHSSSNPSRWVLELYPDEIDVWRKVVRQLAAKPITERERSFLRSLDYYLVSERKITIPMLRWFLAIATRYGVLTPEVPFLPPVPAKS